MYFQVDRYRSAQLVCNYFGIHGYSLRYNDVTFEGDKIILKRHWRTEGPDLFPYFDVGFDLRWSPSSPGVVQMVAKKALYSYNLTEIAQRRLDRRPQNVSSHDRPHQGSDSEYALQKEAAGEIFKFSNPLIGLTSDFLKISAEFVFNSAENAVYFVPNDKSKPRIKLTAD
ncbi:hypothetical protein FOZ61_007430 [Perkinsus olseni]|uniref:Uncharacterized protein n=1 Tax=Perkinsus olseni TaxID=32597 RepID=A0A7J6L919_PEROL|nr:hypothetical protein FOZ61_007430 [Perkinsus olseni]